MNYLDIAFKRPDQSSLALFDTHREALDAFNACRADAERLGGMVCHVTDLTFRFAAGGRLRFGPLISEFDIQTYRGGDWRTIFTDQIRNRKLVTLAMAYLHRPVYNGHRNGV